MLGPENIVAPNDGKEPIAKSVRDFIRRCPYLPEYSRYINVNYLSEETDAFAIETIIAEPLIKRYVNGDAIKEYQFFFTSREEYSKDVIENIKSSEFYELFAGWLEECSKQGVLPTLDGNRKSLQIEAKTQGYIESSQNSKAKYVIQCGMRYFESY